MMYVDNLTMIYGGSLELHEVHTQKQKCNIETNKLGVVECADKYEVSCGDEDKVACLYEGVFSCLDKNGKDHLDVYFIHARQL